MPDLETLERFIARVEQNAHAEAIQEFYAEGASMRENQSAPRVGRDTLVARARGPRESTDGAIDVCPSGFRERRQGRDPMDL
jgi:hypothetical protein